MAMGLLKTLRPHQWVKNLFVLAPLFFSKKYLDPDKLALGISGALLFCLAAGSVYLINDIFDVEKDRQHPVKQHRPIPSGQLPIPVAQVAAVVLALGTVGTCALIEPMLAVVVGGYLVMNLAYSTVLKEVAFLDVSIIAIGFVLRVLAGKYAIDVYVSEWLIACTFFLALYLGLGKRAHELHLQADDDAGDSRDVLERYRLEHLDFGLLFVGGVTIAIYTIYTVTAALPELADALTAQPLRRRPTPFATPYLPATVLFAVFGITRFYQLVDSDSPKSPTDLILEDVPFIVNLGLWGIAMLTCSFAV
jgi:4-hydroxybenzoate polyprenyltransferase